MGKIDPGLAPIDTRKKPELSDSTWSLRVDSPHAAECYLSYKNLPLRPRDLKLNLTRKEMQDTITPAETPGPWAVGDTSAWPAGSRWSSGCFSRT